MEIPAEIMSKINEAASKEEIYEPKYGGKDHSGYDTMMKYEINYERSECFEKGAIFGYTLEQKELEEKDIEIEQVTNTSTRKEIELRREIKNLREINALTEAKIVEWSNMCLKKQVEIERLNRILNMQQKSGRV